MNRPQPGDRLTADIVALITHVTAPLGETSTALARQAEAAHVVRYSATMLDVAVPSEIAGVDLSDGPTPCEAFMYEGDRLVGELLVWVRGGRLIGLEQAWYTDEAPTSWPSPNQVRVT